MEFPKFLRIAAVKKYLLNSKNETDLSKISPVLVICKKLIDLLATKFRFTYELVTPNDAEYGRLLPNGNWSGMVGMLMRGDADLIIDNLSIMESRKQVIDFSIPFYIDRWTFSALYIKDTHRTTSFLKPFTIEVWIALIISLLISSLISHILFKKKDSKKILKHNQFSLRTFNWKAKSGLYFYKSGCLIAGTFIRHFYASVLLSYLIIVPLNDVRTIPDLVKAVKEGRYRCTSFTNHFIPSILEKVNDTNIKLIARSISEYEDAGNIHYKLNDRKSNYRIAYFGLESYLKSFKKQYFVSEDAFFTDLIAIGIKKDFCCKKQLDSFLNYLMASGIFNKFIEYDHFHKIVAQILSEYEEHSWNSLSIKDFEGIFLILFIGYILSTVALFFEYMYYFSIRIRKSN